MPWARTIASSGSHTTPSETVRSGAGTKSSSAAAAAAPASVTPTARPRTSSSRGLVSTCQADFSSGHTTPSRMPVIAISAPTTKNSVATNSAMANSTPRR